MKLWWLSGLNVAGLRVTFTPRRMKWPLLCQRWVSTVTNTGVLGSDPESRCRETPLVNPDLRVTDTPDSDPDTLVWFRRKKKRAVCRVFLFLIGMNKLWVFTQPAFGNRPLDRALFCFVLFVFTLVY